MNTMIIDSTTDEDNRDDSTDNDHAIFIYIYIYVHPPQSRFHAFQVMTYVVCIHRFYPTYYMVTFLTLNLCFLGSSGFSVFNVSDFTCCLNNSPRPVAGGLWCIRFCNWAGDSHEFRSGDGFAINTSPSRKKQKNRQQKQGSVVFLESPNVFVWKYKNYVHICFFIGFLQTCLFFQPSFSNVEGWHL